MFMMVTIPGTPSRSGNGKVGKVMGLYYLWIALGNWTNFQLVQKIINADLFLIGKQCGTVCPTDLEFLLYGKHVMIIIYSWNNRRLKYRISNHDHDK